MIPPPGQPGHVPAGGHVLYPWGGGSQSGRVRYWELFDGRWRACVNYVHGGSKFWEPYELDPVEPDPRDAMNPRLVTFELIGPDVDGDYQPDGKPRP